METDYWAHYYAENGIKDEVEDEDFDLEKIMAEAEKNPDDWEEVINDGGN